MTEVCNGVEGDFDVVEEDVEDEGVPKAGEMGLRKKACLRVAKMYYNSVKDMGHGLDIIG